MNSGLIIANRYVLDSAIESGLPLVESWLAMDTRLNTPVTILLAEEQSRRSFRDSTDEARTSRHAQLARIIEVGLLESDDHDEAGRPFVVLERPAGLMFSDLFSRRIIPTPVARALIGEAARAVEAAASLGLRHGAITPELLSVTNQGRVVLAGAGIAANLTNLQRKIRDVTERDDALALALLFVRAVTGLDPSEVSAEDLPRDLTRAERDLAFVVSDSAGRPSLTDLFRVFPSWNRQLLRSLPLKKSYFPRLASIVVELPEPEATVTDLEAAIEALRERGAEPSESAVDTLESDLEADEDWRLAELEELVLVDEVPTVPEALLEFLHRRFPSSPHIERLLERARDRTLAGPQFDATPWLLLGGLVVVSIVGIFALRWFTGPFVPTVDLNNPPPQEYPEYTFYPSETPPSDL